MSTQKPVIELNRCGAAGEVAYAQEIYDAIKDEKIIPVRSASQRLSNGAHYAMRNAPVRHNLTMVLALLGLVGKQDIVDFVRPILLKMQQEVVQACAESDRANLLTRVNKRTEKWLSRKKQQMCGLDVFIPDVNKNPTDSYLDILAKLKLLLNGAPFQAPLLPAISVEAFCRALQIKTPSNELYLDYRPEIVLRKKKSLGESEPIFGYVLVKQDNMEDGRRNYMSFDYALLCASLGAEIARKLFDEYSGVVTKHIEALKSSRIKERAMRNQKKLNFQLRHLAVDTNGSDVVKKGPTTTQPSNRMRPSSITESARPNKAAERAERRNPGRASNAGDSKLARELDRYLVLTDEVGNAEPQVGKYSSSKTSHPKKTVQPPRRFRTASSTSASAA